MKAFLDTSVLVPLFYEEHPHHASSHALYSRYEKHDMGCSAHTLAEVYSSLTRMPGKDRIGKDDALLYVESLHDRLRTITLDEREHFNAIRAACEQGITGGAIYDALIAQCALKAQAEALYTWNVRHFTRLGPAIAPRVSTP